MRLSEIQKQVLLEMIETGKKLKVPKGGLDPGPCWVSPMGEHWRSTTALAMRRKGLVEYDSSPVWYRDDYRLTELGRDIAQGLLDQVRKDKGK